MKTTAAILLGTNHLIVDELEIPPLKEGQVLVEVAYSGVCHTQLLEVRGHRGNDPYLPHCLGHEGSGRVMEIGPGVTKVKPGDFAILSWIKGSGANAPNTAYSLRGKHVNAGSITTFMRHTVISENRLTPIANSFPLPEAALLGCALPTGLGSVFNTAQPKRGQSLAIFGCGGVGLCALHAAVLAGCSPLIAVDPLEEKRKLAIQAGATHAFHPETSLQEIQKLGALDFAVEASGNPLAMEQAIEAIRDQGGTAVIIGNARFGTHLQLNPRAFNHGKRLLGTWGGDNQPDVHYPKYCELIEQGKICLAPFLKNSYPLEKINVALQDLEEGKALRPMIDMSLS